MAKGSNLITDGLRGNLGNLTFVRSKRYEEHIRRKRGTVKPAVLNESMLKSSQRMASANIPAKVIFDAVRDHHKDGELWNKLCVIFRRQLKAGIPFHINDLKDLECHEKFKLDKLMARTQYAIQIAQNADKLCIELVMKEHPNWLPLGWTNDFQYQLSMVIIYPNLETGSFIKEIAHGPVTGFKSPVVPLLFEVPIPEAANRYVAFLLATACENGKACEHANARGMGVVGIGERTI